MSTQDGYDWPNNVQDERWPADKYQPAAPYFREQLSDEALTFGGIPLQFDIRLSTVAIHDGELYLKTQ